MSLPSYVVKLQYFQERGKYYSSGEYISHKRYMFEIFGEVRHLQESGKLPDLVEGGGKSFSIYVEVPEHPHDHPALIHPNQEF